MSVAVGKIEIKVGNKDIEVYSIQIDKDKSLITVTCGDKSYEMFNQWRKISDAHRHSIDYKKANIVKDIKIHNELYCNCQVYISDEPTNHLHDWHKLCFLFDYCKDLNPIGDCDGDRAVDLLNDLFS